MIEGALNCSMKYQDIQNLYQSSFFLKMVCPSISNHLVNLCSQHEFLSVDLPVDMILCFLSALPKR